MMKYLENTLNEKAREAAERALGYRFKNRALLTQAFTRASYANEMKQIGLAVESNEVPEFFGDAILSAVVADYLFSSYATVDERGLHTDRAEGELTLEKISLTDKSTLSHRIRELELDRYLLSTVGTHEVTVTDSMAEDLFEALACAVWVDSGRNFATVREAVLRLLAPEKREASPTVAAVTQKATSPLLSPKNAVQEFCDQHKIAFTYETLGQSGPDHDPTFTVRLTVEGIFATEASAGSKRAAETEAATRMLPYLNEDALSLPRHTEVTASGGRTPKSEVKEWCDKRHLTPVYRVVEQSGPDHDPTFTVRLTVSFPETVGVAHSIKAAEAQAAQAMLDRIPDTLGANSVKGAVAAWCDMNDCTFVYRLIKQEGPDHDPTFTVGLSVVLVQTEASAKNRRAAETAAAAEMLADYRQTVEELLTEDDDSVFLEEEEKKAARKPARVELKELCEKYGIGFSISDPEKEGSDHAPIYTATVTVEGLGAVGGTGANKKDAREDAARHAMELLAGTEEADWDETERKRRLEGALSALYLKKAFRDDEL